MASVRIYSGSSLQKCFLFVRDTVQILKTVKALFTLRIANRFPSRTPSVVVGTRGECV